MADTYLEIHDHLSFVSRAQGHVLINGLGLGICVQDALDRTEVTKATVIELSPDVIALVAPHYRQRYGDRVEIIEADALTWTPPKGVRYGAVWHDIWDYICEDNLPVMTQLKRKYGRRCDWQGCWAEYDCRHRR